MALDLGPKAFFHKKKGAVYGLNFIRTRNRTRTAWEPAVPRWWSFHPRTNGVVFFRCDKAAAAPK